MKKFEEWHESKDCEAIENEKEREETYTRLVRLEDRLSAVVDWIIEREKRGGGANPKRKSKDMR